jgi:hypothetical protein
MSVASEWIKFAEAFSPDRGIVLDVGCEPG